jgi:Actin
MVRSCGAELRILEAEGRLTILPFLAELQAVVSDIGTAVTKIGFAGNDVPHALISTVSTC